MKLKKLNILAAASFLGAAILPITNLSNSQTQNNYKNIALVNWYSEKNPVDINYHVEDTWHNIVHDNDYVQLGSAKTIFNWKEKTHQILKERGKLRVIDGKEITKDQIDWYEDFKWTWNPSIEIDNSYFNEAKFEMISAAGTPEPTTYSYKKRTIRGAHLTEINLDNKLLFESSTYSNLWSIFEASFTSKRNSDISIIAKVIIFKQGEELKIKTLLNLHNLSKLSFLGLSAYNSKTEVTIAMLMFKG